MKWSCSCGCRETSVNSSRPCGVGPKGGMAMLPSNFVINASLQEAAWKAQLGMFQWRGIFLIKSPLRGARCVWREVRKGPQYQVNKELVT